MCVYEVHSADGRKMHIDEKIEKKTREKENKQPNYVLLVPIFFHYRSLSLSLSAPSHSYGSLDDRQQKKNNKKIVHNSTIKNIYSC